MSTPNMGITLPTDHGSVDVWDTVLDTAFGVVDSHNHTPGRGALIPSGALGIDGDVSWSSSGESFSITDLLSIDFRPSAAADVVLQAGALFVSDGSGALSANELYFRTTSGTNVKMTSGAALNVAAFAGGIGGDYSAAGSLVVFDDSTDAYWFQQQVGAAVRQYARMRSADVALYEYKAHPTAGVPTFAVTLKSPAALAASYSMTMPAALPASIATVRVSSAGVLTAATPPPRQFPASLIQAAFGTAGGLAPGGGGSFALSTSVAENWCPLTLAVGEVLTSWTMFLFKATIAGTITARAWDLDMSTNVPTQIGATQSNSAVFPGAIQLGQSGLSTTVAAGHAYFLDVTGTGAAGDFVRGYQITNT